MKNQTTKRSTRCPLANCSYYMLTKDIPLIPAIMDLVDNCNDGAKKLRGEKSLKGLSVEINVTPDEFSISDNCGSFYSRCSEKNMPFDLDEPMAHLL